MLVSKVFLTISSDPKVLVPVEPQFASIGGVISERMGIVGIGMAALLTGIRLTIFLPGPSKGCQMGGKGCHKATP